MVDPRMPAIRPIEFWTKYVNDPARPGEKRAEDWVRWVKLGESLGATTAEKVARLMPRDATGARSARPPAIEWTVIEPYYKAWKEGQEPPTTGTPLAAWPGATDGLVKALQERRIKTVDEFAALADHEMSKIQVPNVRFYWTAAKNFLEAQEGASHVEAELSKRDAKIEELERMIAELAAARSAPSEDEKPKRGRPRKAAAEVDLEDAGADAA